MKKTLATIGATTTLALGGLGLASMASAQTAESTDVDTTATDDGTTEEREGRRGNRGDGRRGHHGDCGARGEAVAELLGIEAEDLRAQLEAGSTLAEIAEANGVDPDDLVDQLVADVTERLDEKVADGRLTEDEAAEKLAEKAERIEDRVFGDHSDGDPDSDDADSDDDADDAVEGEGS